MTGSDFDWMVSSHAAWGWKAPVKASVSGVSLLHLSPFFASIFSLFPQKRLILRLHGGSVCSFPKQILEMPDKHPPAECWEMGTLCCCHGRCQIKRGGESGGREKGGKEMLHFFSQLFPFAFISPSPPTSSSSPFLPLPCRLNALLRL